jgi:AraC-like DNA-binding protein
MMSRPKPLFTAQMRHLEGAAFVYGRCRHYAFPKHHHDTCTIGIVLSGREQITCGNTRFGLAAGALYFNNPGESHDGACVDSEGWTFQSLYFSPACLDTCEYQVEFTRFLVEDAALRNIVTQAFSVFASSSCPLETQSALAILFEQSLAFHRRAEPRPPGREANAVSRARRYLEEHRSSAVSLQDLAMVTGLNANYLIACFKRELGVTPHAYLVACRANLALRLITAGASVSQAAIDSGFYDQSHLHRHFRRLFGITPKQAAAAGAAA